jgi:hypothetical protein
MIVAEMLALAVEDERKACEQIAREHMHRAWSAASELIAREITAAIPARKKP